MANRSTWKYNIHGRAPVRKKVRFQAGSSQTVERGDLLELSGSDFVPLTSDKAMAATVAIADHEITASHLAGYYPAIIPQPGDVFELPLAAAANPDLGANLYVNGAQELTDSGSNVLGNVWDHGGFPRQQGNADVGDVADRGTTIQNVNSVLFTIKEGASYYNALQGDDA